MYGVCCYDKHKYVHLYIQMYVWHPCLHCTYTCTYVRPFSQGRPIAWFKAMLVASVFWLWLCVDSVVALVIEQSPMVTGPCLCHMHHSCPPPSPLVRTRDNLDNASVCQHVITVLTTE
jgi:hypothetical protein